MAGMVGFCGSRTLLASAADSAFIGGVVGSVLAASPSRGVAVGCAVGGDALVVSAALPAGASSQLRVFAAFGPSSRPGPPPASPLPARLPPSPGGPGAVPRSPWRAASSPALISGVAASGAGRGFVGFVSSPCPTGLVPSPSPSACFSGFGSGSWASLALAVGLKLPVVVFPVSPSGYGRSPGLPAFWPGSWIPLSGVWAGGFRFAPVPPPQGTLF